MAQKHAVNGFSVLDIVIVLALLISIAGVVVPIVSGGLEDTKASRALEDCGRIGFAVRQYSIDLGFEPGSEGGSLDTSTLVSSGEIPAGLGGNIRELLAESLSDKGKPASGQQYSWKGPYLGETGADPWGRAYVVWLGSRAQNGRAWVISAGANGRLETSDRSDSLMGDDIGIQLR